MSFVGSQVAPKSADNWTDCTARSPAYACPAKCMVRPINVDPVAWDVIRDLAGIDSIILKSVSGTFVPGATL